VTTPAASDKAPSQTRPISLFGCCTAPRPAEETKNPADMRIAASGTPPRATVAAKPCRCVASAKSWQSRPRMTSTPAVPGPAPAHHFGDKAGLLTALAVEGFTKLAAELRAAGERTGSFLEVGVAYVGFAVRHPAHFAVMYRPDLYHAADPAVQAARDTAAAPL